MLLGLLRRLKRGGSFIRQRDISSKTDTSLACKNWFDELTKRIFRLMHNVELDNFDESRYSGISPQTFFADQHAAFFLFLIRNIEQFYSARMLLADDASKALYDQLILYRVLGHQHVRLPFNNLRNRAHILTAERWRVVDTADTGVFGPLSIYHVPREGSFIRVKGWKENVVATFLYRQYFFERNGVRIMPVKKDHIIDAGGCFGDTALGFAHEAGERGHVYVFDPMPKHCAIMHEVLAMNPALAPRISVFRSGLSDNANGAAGQPDDDKIDPGARIASDTMATTTIDEFAMRNKLSRLDFIKMDIEGSEYRALCGAQASLRRWLPKLAISLYHRPEDFFAIPLWINALGLGYRMFLDHYSIHNEETVLYASI